MNIKKIISAQIEDSIAVKKRILTDIALLEKIGQAALWTIEAYRNGNKTILAGNGGSAADAQHIAGEFVSKFYFDRPGLPSVAITTDTSILTAIGNDYGYDRLFARQMQAQGIEGDVFIGISTSGNSENIIQALKVCKEKKIKSICLTGNTGGRIKECCDLCIQVPSTETPRIQEAHILIGHILCCIVEKEIFGNLKL